MSKLYYKDQLATLVQGDCLNVMKKMPDNSVDAIVTDPPYGINFMGKKWDYDVPTSEVWKEALRVLKPGGHILCACGTRTQHRMAVNLEDAGFEIRDIVAWVYGSGFPKSMDISKAIDKKAGAEREIVGKREHPTLKDKTKIDRQECTQYHASNSIKDEWNITAPSTQEAKQWEGWGTALKPAMELFTLARKPLSEKTVAENVLKWGIGGINIDECRVEGTQEYIDGKGNPTPKQSGDIYGFTKYDKLSTKAVPNPEGRFPANIIFDETAGKVLDEQSGIRKSGGKVSGKEPSTTGQNGIYGHYDRVENQPFNDIGGASRFFYCAKASKSERGEGNNHPTVKPIKLIEYLIKLITPKDGTVLDPFVGSGTTLLASNNLHIKSIGIELEESYCEIIKNRLETQTGKQQEHVLFASNQ